MYDDHVWSTTHDHVCVTIWLITYEIIYDFHIWFVCIIVSFINIIHMMIIYDRHMIIYVKPHDNSHMKSYMISIYDLYILQFHLSMYTYMMIIYERYMIIFGTSYMINIYETIYDSHIWFEWNWVSFLNVCVYDDHVYERHMIIFGTPYMIDTCETTYDFHIWFECSWVIIL